MFTSISSLGGGGGGTVGIAGGRFLAATDEGTGLVSGGKGGSTATPSGRAPPKPQPAGSGVSPGGVSSVSTGATKSKKWKFYNYKLKRCELEKKH